MASSPCTPQAQGRPQTQQLDAVRNPSDAVINHVNTLTEQLLSFTITKSKHKRAQASATPASQSRPRTQRRTSPVGQEFTPASAANSAGSRGENVTPSRLSCLSELQDELSCAVCLDICVRPCATPCGHAFCKSCLRQALHVKRQCPKCRANLPPASSWQPKVNTALWNTIQLLFPKHAAQAPPPTPEVQAAAVSSNRLATTTGGSSGQPRHRRMANALATGAAAGVFANDVSVRRSFRPPRPANGSQGSQPRTRSRQQHQQHIDQFVMPADLGAMLQEMYHTGAGSASAHPLHSTATQGGTAARAASQERQPFSRRRQQQQQQASQALQGPNQFTRLQQEALGADESDDWADFDFGMLDDLSSQPAHQHGIDSSHRQPELWQARRPARAAAAARVHAAIAEDLDAVTAAAADEYDEALRTAILASLHDPGVAQATVEPAAAQSRSQPAAAASSQHAVNGSSRQQRPSRQLSASLFGLMHSGRSPQLQWAVDSDDDVQLHDGLLDDATVPPASIDSSSMHSTATATVAAPAVVVVDRLSELEDDEEVQLRTPGAELQHNLTAAAVYGSDNVAGRRRHGRARVIMDDEEEEVGQLSTGRVSTTAAGSAPVASADGRSSTVNQQGPLRGSMNHLDSGAVTNSERGSEFVEELEVDVLQLAQSPDPPPLAARLAWFTTHPQEPQQQQPAGNHDIGSSSSAAAAFRGRLTVDSSINDSTEGPNVTEARKLDQAIDAPGAHDDDSDDFEPVTQRRLTAALAARAVQLAGRTAAGEGGIARRVPAGRVVAGLRRGARAKQ